MMSDKPTGSLRYHSIRRNKSPHHCAMKHSISEDDTGTNHGSVITPVSNTNSIYATVADNTMETSKLNMSEQQGEPSSSVDFELQQYSGEFSVSVCDDQAITQRRPPPMSFTRRIVSFVSMGFRKPSRLSSRDFAVDDTFVYADEQASAISGTIPNEPEKSRDIVHQIHQGTEESDVQIVMRDLQEKNLTSPGGRGVEVAKWISLLFKNTPLSGGGGQNRGSPRHMLKYARTSCTCLACLTHRVSSSMGSTTRKSSNSPCTPQQTAPLSFLLPPYSDLVEFTPESSAFANFVRQSKLPEQHLLRQIGGRETNTLFPIGTLVRLHSRSGAKLVFTDGMKSYLSHYAYTGPHTHEDMYRTVTTIGVEYHENNKGLKNRRVYIQGTKTELPIEIGIVKLGTIPLRSEERRSKYVLYRRQKMQIYCGRIVLEGNTSESYIPTNMSFFVGFGEKDGCAPVYPGEKLGPPRQLGINELLLHHHMVEPIEVLIR